MEFNYIIANGFSQAELVTYYCANKYIQLGSGTVKRQNGA